MAPRCWIPWFSGTKCSELSWSRCQNMWGAGVIFWLGFFKQNGRWGSHMSHSCCLEAPELFMSWLKFQSLTNKKQRSTMIDLTHAMKTGGTTGMVCGTPIIKQPQLRRSWLVMAGFFSGFHNPQTPRSLTDSIQLDHTPMDLQEGHQVQGVGEPRGGEFRWCLFCPDFSDLTLRKALSNNTIEINWVWLSLVVQFKKTIQWGYWTGGFLPTQLFDGNLELGIDGRVPDVYGRGGQQKLEPVPNLMDANSFYRGLQTIHGHLTIETCGHSLNFFDIPDMFRYVQIVHKRCATLHATSVGQGLQPPCISMACSTLGGWPIPS